jgi:uncharacterized protein
MKTTFRAAFLPALALMMIAAPVSAQDIHPNSIQPETTLDVVATAQSNVAPDLAIVTAGVNAQGKTASEAMAAQARSMNAMFDVLKAAGVEARDMQTSGLTLYPEYDYVTINEDNGVQRQESRLRGYLAANALTLRVRDLDALGGLLDKLVGVGGNTINGVSFGLDDPSAAQDDARRKAVAAAQKRAELYAAASGNRVGRMVSMVEQMTYDSPGQWMQHSAGAAVEAVAPTPVAAGQVGYSITINVKYELVK